MNLLNCEICIEPFNENEKSPYVFHCGHSICHSCLKKFIQSTKINEIVDEEHLSNSLYNNKKIQFNCHTCKKSLIYSNKEEIPKNFSLLDIIRQFNKPSYEIFKSGAIKKEFLTWIFLKLL